MPKLGMEPIRREALVKATIAEIGTTGKLDVTVAQIARRAGMSSALAHHYFGSKEHIFLAAMRHVLTAYGREVRAALAGQTDPRKRLEAVVKASFAPTNFGGETIGAWMQFYVLAQSNADVRKLLSVYHRRLDSNLRHALRRLAPDRVEPMIRTLSAMIDGAYLRQALGPGQPQAEVAVDMVLNYIALELGRGEFTS